MEVKPKVLQKLICSICKEYLSVGPVMLLEAGQSVCGRCSPPDEPVHRNLPYESLAEAFLFPCQNSKHGCKVKCLFGQLQNHEARCKFRQYACFISETRTCKWLGPKQEILQHCKETHPEHVVPNPVKLKHDISKASVKSYLMSAFHMIFLIHTKVCLKNKQIYHCVRLIGDSGNIGHFNYSLVVTKGDNNVSKKGVVATQGCMAIKEDDSLAIGIGSLLDIFTIFKGTTFTLTVNSLNEKPCAQPKQEIVKELCCFKCGINITHSAVYFDDGKLFCSGCIDNKHICSNKNCKYTETNHKVTIHKTYYCSFESYCDICMKHSDVPLERHYQLSHADITYLSGEMFIKEYNLSKKNHFIVTSEFGLLLLLIAKDDFWWYNLNVSSPIPSDSLRDYTCQVMLQNPVSGLTLHKILPLFRHETICVCDWQLKIKLHEFEQYVLDGKFKIAVKITKTN